VLALEPGGIAIEHLSQLQSWPLGPGSLKPQKVALQSFLSTIQVSHLVIPQYDLGFRRPSGKHSGHARPTGTARSRASGSLSTWASTSVHLRRSAWHSFAACVEVFTRSLPVSCARGYTRSSHWSLSHFPLVTTSRRRMMQIQPLLLNWIPQRLLLPWGGVLLGRV
jgi:hypothetical protein